jgi:hypothetical protein
MSSYLKKVLSQPLNANLKRALKACRDIILRQWDLQNRTYHPEFAFDPRFENKFGRISVATLHNLNVNQYSHIIRHYTEHRFDLLGSGWVRVYHGMECRGLEGYKFDMGQAVNVDQQGEWLADRINSSNLAESQRIWKLVDPDYTPIDWHIDFKSGYRWAEKTWFKDIKYGHKLGVDIKVPWELARMQHLPQTALYFHSLPENSGERNLFQREFRNQVLDFIATSPPHFGVNWRCAMDVAIRAVNWLVAYDLFRAGGALFDEEFEMILTRSIYEHGLHIINNLEWSNQSRGNHYLADITGLAFIAAYLPATTQTDAWLAFAVQELVTEVEHQFYPDGGNFEGSTAYHRLSAEMVYFATALILGLPRQRFENLKKYDHTALKTGWGKLRLKPAPLAFYSLPEGSVANVNESPFPPWYFERMERMAEFIMDITKPNGHIPQIGDNDSGRFLKLGPKYEVMTVKRAREKYANLDGYSELPDDAEYLMEDHLDCSHLIAAGHGLFRRTDFENWLGGKEKAANMPDYTIIKSMLGGSIIGSQRFHDRQQEDNEFFAIGREEDFQNALTEIKSKPTEQVQVFEFSAQDGELSQDLTLRAYPDFGLYLFTSPNHYLAVRCWSGREPYHAGHMHYDQLSFELVIDGKELVTDPGTYIYTPLPETRWLYRCADSHFSSFFNDNLSDNSSIGLFAPIKIEQMNTLYFGTKGFSAGKNIENNRKIYIVHIPGKIISIYYVSSVISPLKNNIKNTIKISPGYGIVLK